MSSLYIVWIQPSGRPVSDGVRNIAYSWDVADRLVREYQEASDSGRYVVMTPDEHRVLLDRFEITSDPATWRYDKEGF